MSYYQRRVVQSDGVYLLCFYLMLRFVVNGL